MCQVIHRNDLTPPFEVKSGVRQGCLLSPMIFLLVTDWIMRQTTRQARGIQWSLTQKLEDLDFADDICLLAHTHRDMQAKTEDLQTNAGQTGLKVNIGKTKTKQCA